MNKARIIIIIFVFFQIAAVELYSHGISYETVKAGTGVRAFYSDGTPVNYSEVKLYAPGSDKPVLETVTDRNGFFMFVPDVKGKWQIKISDGMGHQVDAAIDADDEMNVSDHSLTHLHSHPGLLQKILITVCVIWGFAGTALYFRAKQQKES